MRRASATRRCFSGYDFSQLFQYTSSPGRFSCTQRIKSSSITKSMISYSRKSFIHTRFRYKSSGMWGDLLGFWGKYFFGGYEENIQQSTINVQYSSNDHFFNT